MSGEEDKEPLDLYIYILGWSLCLFEGLFGYTNNGLETTTTKKSSRVSNYNLILLCLN